MPQFFPKSLFRNPICIPFSVLASLGTIPSVCGKFSIDSNGENGKVWSCDERKYVCRGWKVGPALATGCTIVMKPSEVTPLTALVRICTPQLLHYQFYLFIRHSSAAHNKLSIAVNETRNYQN